MSGSLLELAFSATTRSRRLVFLGLGGRGGQAPLRGEAHHLLVGERPDDLPVGNRDLRLPPKSKAVQVGPLSRAPCETETPRSRRGIRSWTCRRDRDARRRDGRRP